MNENKAFVMEYLQALSGKGKDPAVVARYVEDPRLMQHIAAFEEAFPQYEFTPEEIISEGDLVAVRATVSGTHQGTFAGLPATGRNISTSVIIIYKIVLRKIVQHWMEVDSIALMSQLTQAANAVHA